MSLSDKRLCKGTTLRTLIMIVPSGALIDHHGYKDKSHIVIFDSCRSMDNLTQ